MTAQEVAEPNTILRCEAGSRVYGLNVEEHGDIDELGVCIEPPEYVIGLRHFEQWVHRTQPEGVRSGPGDLDLTVYGLRKWCSLALKGNPTILLMLFVPRKKCSVWQPYYAEPLQGMVHSLASRQAGGAFLGYMQQQRQRLLGERGQMKVKRVELEAAHGYDTKYAGHIARLGFQGIEFLSTGRISVPMPVEQRDYILSVRRGDVPFSECMTFSGELEAELKASIDASPLPEKPDYDNVNRWIVSMYRDWWDENGLLAKH